MRNPPHEFQSYFDEIKEIWRKFDFDGAIMPFCTPVNRHARFLVIGETFFNDFCLEDERENQRISQLYAREIPIDDHSYLHHSMPFAQGLRDVVDAVHQDYPSFRITSDWIGTCRCPLQTNGKGIAALRRAPHFKSCQAEMDELLMRLIRDIRPQNVLLVGRYACRLNFDWACKEKQRLMPGGIQNLRCLRGHFIDGSGKTFGLLPIWQFLDNERFNKPGEPSLKDKTIERLKQALGDDICQL